MYTKEERRELLTRIIEYTQAQNEFEGLLQIGSGAIGFADIYSDIDLMAGCLCNDEIEAVHRKLLSFFQDVGAVYIDERVWSKTVLGVSVYFENGLSVDMSYMPTEEIRIHSNQVKIVFAKTKNFLEFIEKELGSNSTNYSIDDSVHHKFIYALRKCEVAIIRTEFIYADIALSEARLLLLNVEAAREGKKLHQFKAYNSLDKGFINKLEKTFPVSITQEALRDAKEAVLALYLDTVDQCDFLKFDKTQLKLIGCFK